MRIVCTKITLLSNTLIESQAMIPLFIRIKFINKNGRAHFVFLKDSFLSLKIVFILANSEDPDEMPPEAAFHLGIQCLPTYPV